MFPEGMPKPQPAKPKLLLTATVSEAVAAAIKTRAKELDWAVAKTARAILQNWYASGEPALRKTKEGRSSADKTVL